MDFICFSKNPARFEMYCFPYAGGGATIYRDWKSLPCEIHALQLPGRENRFHESFLKRLTLVVENLIKISPFSLPSAKGRKPFIFFGHSLGALIAFELVHQLQKNNCSLPQLLIVSGARAPQAQRPIRNIYQYSDSELIKEVKALGGVAQEFFQWPELMKELFPILRADLEMAETYIPTQRAPLKVPILALGGSSDAEVSPEELAAWNLETSQNFESRFFEGGHFFIHSAQKEVLDFLSIKINALS